MWSPYSHLQMKLVLAQTSHSEEKKNAFGNSLAFTYLCVCHCISREVIFFSKLQEYVFNACENTL